MNNQRENRQEVIKNVTSGKDHNVPILSYKTLKMIWVISSDYNLVNPSLILNNSPGDT